MQSFCREQQSAGIARCRVCRQSNLFAYSN